MVLMLKRDGTVFRRVEVEVGGQSIRAADLHRIDEHRFWCAAAFVVASRVLERGTALLESADSIVERVTYEEAYPELRSGRQLPDVYTIGTVIAVRDI